MGTPRRIDLTGLRCPLPIVKLNQIFKDLNSGDELEAVASDPAFCLDVEAWCKLTGHELLGMQKSDGVLVATIRTRR